MDSEESEKEIEEKVDNKEKKKKKGKKGKKGKKKTKGAKIPKDMITNDRGELVTMKELDATQKAKTNEDLQENLKQQEKDALEVIAALHKGIVTILNEKESAYKVMQQEFSTIKDFRRKRHQMMQELEAQKQELEAVQNLKETTKEVFKENIRMAEALRYHVEAGDELNKTNAKLSQANKTLEEEQDLHNVIIVHLKGKIQQMEHALAHVVTEFEQEREMIGNLARQELEQVRTVLKRLKANLARKTLEMKHIKILAQHILNQRSDLEKFFMDSLEMSKKIPPIQSSTTENKRDLSDLTWEEREKVLRVLFAKMNGTSLAKTAQRAEQIRQEIEDLRSQAKQSRNGFSQDPLQNVESQSVMETDAGTQSIPLSELTT
ncbi:hypothetical protein EDD86DRAFT_244973 [Gorgonomyces haynaldii]|nr:hypothetical protein EDD86DRAFT_244973 [Gorgonomyces haynaldii]